MHWSNIDGQIFTKMRRESKKKRKGEILSKSDCESAYTHCVVWLENPFWTSNGHK